MRPTARVVVAVTRHNGRRRRRPRGHENVTSASSASRSLVRYSARGM